MVDVLTPILDGGAATAMKQRLIAVNSFHDRNRKRFGWLLCGGERVRKHGRVAGMRKSGDAEKSLRTILIGVASSVALEEGGNIPRSLAPKDLPDSTK